MSEKQQHTETKVLKNEQALTKNAPKKSAQTENSQSIKAQAAALVSAEKKASRFPAFLLTLIILLIATTAVSLLLGKFSINPYEALMMLLSKVFPIEQTWTDQEAGIFFNVRLPRILLALLVGASLSVAGAAFQGLFQNPLVSPDILGASQGAAFGAALAILLGFSMWGVSINAFIFSLLTVAIVLLISIRASGNKILIVVLAGIMMSMLMSAAVSYIKLVADQAQQLPTITYWLMGSLTGADMKKIAIAAPIMIVGMLVIFLIRWRINVLTLGDDEAKTLGVNVEMTRLVLIIAATVITATSVAIAGVIGWVGLIIPHICRMIIGPDYRKLIPTSIFAGALFLLIIDDIARLCSTAEIPIGILTAFIGSPFFIYLIVRKKKR